ncbi:MAG TPA: acylphosphatase [Thiobacillus sp.]
MKTLHLKILGKVQGVWFRESMRAEAERSGVTGWVCNRADGSVEAVIQGPHESVELLLTWAHTGPSRARVEHVIVSESEGQFDQFEKRDD